MYALTLMPLLMITDVRLQPYAMVNSAQGSQGSEFGFSDTDLNVGNIPATNAAPSRYEACAAWPDSHQAIPAVIARRAGRASFLLRGWYFPLNRAMTATSVFRAEAPSTCSD